MPPAAPPPSSSACGRPRNRCSSSRISSDEAPFCGPNVLGASSSVARVSYRTMVGAGSSPSTSSKPAPASIVAVPPRQTSSRGHSPTAAISSPNPRLEAAPASSRAGSSGIASALSTTTVPSSSDQIGASRPRPNASGTYTRRTTWAPSTSAVPSPPSAIGAGSASTPARAKPSARSRAASRAERTPWRLAGDASARTGLAAFRRSRFLGLLFGHLRLARVRHPAQHREREALPREEDPAHADADRGLDRRQQKADVPRPEREQRGDVHQQENEPGGGQRRVDVESAHRGVHGEELAQ